MKQLVEIELELELVLWVFEVGSGVSQAGI